MEELGPTFIKLGQLLSTRPGPARPGVHRAARNAPGPRAARGRAADPGRDREPARRKGRGDLRELRPASPRGREHRPGPPRRDPRRAAGGGEGPPAGHRQDAPHRVRDARRPGRAHQERVLRRQPAGPPAHGRRSSPRRSCGRWTSRPSGATRSGSPGNFAGDEGIHIPEVYREYCSEGVLTMEYVGGIKPSNLAALDDGGYDRKLLALRGAEFVLEQIFDIGFFHADPHPGNFFMLPGNVVAAMDFGQVARLTEADRAPAPGAGAVHRRRERGSADPHASAEPVARRGHRAGRAHARHRGGAGPLLEPVDFGHSVPAVADGRLRAHPQASHPHAGGVHADAQEPDDHRVVRQEPGPAVRDRRSAQAVRRAVPAPAAGPAAGSSARHAAWRQRCTSWSTACRRISTRS